MKFPRVLVATLSLALVVAGAYALRHMGGRLPQARETSTAVMPQDGPGDGPTRPVYPYSVIAGGVYDAKEAKAYVESDAVVRQHYHDVRIDRLVPQRTSRPLNVHVSYRKGDRVLWTARRILIPEGERVISDGQNLIRARCGNRMQELPPPPAETAKEDPPELVAEPNLPTSRLFDSPPPTVVKPPTEHVAETALPPGKLFDYPPPTVVNPPIVSAKDDHPIGTPPAVPPLLAPTESVEEPPAPVVPEPGTLILLVSGVAGLGGLAWRRRKL